MLLSLTKLSNLPQIYFEKEINFSKSQIGVLLAMPCICTIISPPIWGAVADSLRCHKLVHIICHVTAALLFFSIQFVSSFPLMCVMVFIAYFQTVPTFSQLDLAAMTWISRVGGDYGKQRLYGAAGYGVGGYVAGVVASSLGISWCFNMVLLVSCVSLFLLVRFVPPGREATPSSNSSIRSTSECSKKSVLVHSLRQILRQYEVLILFVVTLLAGVIGNLIDNYLLLFIYNLSSEDDNIAGAFVAVQTVSELPFFFLANKIIARFGTPACISVTLVAAGVRTMVYTFTPHAWPVLPVETLHGLTYGLFFAALTNYIYAAAPKGAEGTMIGLLATFQRGLGGGLASLGGGYIYDTYGSRIMWGVAGFCVCPLALLGVGMFAWLARRNQAPDSLKVQLVDEETLEEGGISVSSPSTQSPCEKQ
jgi:oligosaccharide:H+ symporter